MCRLMQRLLAFRLELLKRSSEDSMWKYRCKTHLLSFLGAFIVGCVVTAIFFFTNTETYLQILPADVYKFISENIWLTCAAGGLSFAGVINIILIAQMLMSLYNLNPFIFIILIMFAAEPLVILGIVLVVPAIIVCIYGMVSLNKERGKEMKAHNFSQDEELVRMYKLHHKLDENVKSLAENCRKNVNKMTYLYILGIVALFCVLFFIQNIMIATLAFLFYMFLFNILLRYRASCLIPITSLLYDKCDPEACASAIIYYSTKNGKVKLKSQTLFAQCLIYLDDPQLAQDILINYPRKDAASSLSYWSLMANIYYLMKDEDGLNRCKEEAQKIQLGFGQTGVMIQNEELSSIQNKIDLMNGEFSTCKKYYLDSLNKARFTFQQVDSCYYIALISFVEQDYPLANMYFDRVINLGNKMCYVSKAKHYQSKMENMNLDINEG